MRTVSIRLNDNDYDLLNEILESSENKQTFLSVGKGRENNN